MPNLIVTSFTRTASEQFISRSCSPARGKNRLTKCSFSEMGGRSATEVVRADFQSEIAISEFKTPTTHSCGRFLGSAVDPRESGKRTIGFTSPTQLRLEYGPQKC